MNELTVFTRSMDLPDVFEVSYANGVQRQGVLRIRVPFEIEHRDVAAELGALYHLLIDRAIYGDDRAGNNLYLTVSRGQVRKLIQRRSGLPELAPWASALSVQFSDANIKIENRSASWEKPRRLDHVSEFTLAERLDLIYQVPCLGPTRLMAHALEQFCARANHIAAHEGWRQLRYMLTPALQRVLRDPELDEIARERHGTSAVILYAPASGWNFVIALPNERSALPTITTVYFRKQQARDLAPLTTATV
ncbi:MAG: hypothetical protein AzoDbin1_01900 [Azoarcus sp.]|nr:hypothetical protein [Azoarcus sp.]